MVGDEGKKSSLAVPDPPGASASTDVARSVFLSYASHDAEVAKSICQFLESHGVSCWMAPRNVPAGALYADAIVRAINEAKALVVLLSQSAVASSHVGKEVERASSKNKKIIAFRVDPAPLTPALEYFLSESQWIDVPALGMPAALTKLAEAVGQGSSAQPRPVSDAKADQHAGKRTKRVAVIAAAVAIVVGVAVALGVHFWSSNHSITQAPAAVAITDKSIAVLPFTDMSEKKDQEYFADGVAEEVLDRLTKVPGLRVVGRASSFQFKGKSADPAGIGAALGVAYLLEGSVRKEAGQVRVTAQLVEARMGSQRWSDHFDSGVVDVLKVQDTMAAEIARALQIAVEVNAAPRSSIKSPEALDAYLRGLQALDRGSQEGLESAVVHFKQALSLDPRFAPAAIGLARAYVWIGTAGWQPKRVTFDRARDAALLAQRLDPQSPVAHVAMAAIHTTYDWDWTGADRELQQASALGPRDFYGAQVAAWLAAARGQWDEARQLAFEAIALDPLNADLHGTLGYVVYLRSGHLVEAEQSLRRALQIAAEYDSGHYFLGESLMLQGRYDAALAEFRREALDAGQLEGSAMVLFATKRKAESDAKLAEAIRVNGTDWPSGIVGVYAFRGEKDHAFEWLDRAYEARDEDLYMIKGDPLLKNLEDDPRYKAFLRKMNLPE
jgi:TolB-like protein